MALNPEIFVNETDEDVNVTVATCFRTNVTQTRKRDAVFVLMLLNSSVMHNFYFQAPYIIIPTGFSGIFLECVNVTIVGDDIIEENEVIEYRLQPLSDRDLVMYPGSPVEPLRIFIVENDGE
jgi:hypothetical protein